MAITNTQVVEAWLKTIDSVPDSLVGPTLPSDNSTWGASGFYQVTTVGGTPNPDLGIKEPVVAISCWAAVAEGSHAPTNRAESYATDIRNAAMSARTMRLTIGATTVFLLGVNAVTEPLRVPDVRTNYARSDVQVQVWWEVLP